MQRVIQRAQQALLLRRHKEDQYRAPRSLGERCERTRNRQYLRATGSVVLRAVIDAVARRIGLTDTEVIVVRRVHDDFALELGVAAGQQARDIRGLHMRHLVGKGNRGADPQRHRLEAARVRGGNQLVEVFPAGLQQPAHRILGRPALDLDRRFPGRRQAELLAPPGALHDLPRITGRGRRVNDDRARRALARRALILVHPAPVVEPALASEQLRIPVGIVVEHHQDLALEIHSLEVVPAVLGSLDAVADEHEFRAIDPALLALHTAAGDVVVRPFQVDVGGMGVERPRGRKGRFDADDIERLLPLSVGAGWLVAERFELRRQIQARQLIAPGGRRAALECVRGEKADRRFQRTAVDCLVRRRIDRRWNQRGLRRSLRHCGRCQQSAHERHHETLQAVNPDHDGPFLFPSKRARYHGPAAGRAPFRYLAHGR